MVILDVEEISQSVGIPKQIDRYAKDNQKSKKELLLTFSVTLSRRNRRVGLSRWGTRDNTHHQGGNVTYRKIARMHVPVLLESKLRKKGCETCTHRTARPLLRLVRPSTPKFAVLANRRKYRNVGWFEIWPWFRRQASNFWLSFRPSCALNCEWSSTTHGSNNCAASRHIVSTDFTHSVQFTSTDSPLKLGIHLTGKFYMNDESQGSRMWTLDTHTHTRTHTLKMLPTGSVGWCAVRAWIKVPQLLAQHKHDYVRSGANERRDRAYSILISYKFLFVFHILRKCTARQQWLSCFV